MPDHHDPDERRVHVRQDNVYLMAWDTDLLRHKYPEWDALTKREKLRLLRTKRPRPQERRATHNVTCIEMHQFLAQAVDPEHDTTDNAARLALGDDDSGTNPFQSSDTSLNNEVGRVDLTDAVYDATNGEVLLSTFIDSGELNGETLAECGIVSEAGRLFNHAGVSPNVAKTNSKTVVIDVILGFSG